MFTAKTVAELETIAEYLLTDDSVKPIILFKGEIGAGKTTLVKQVLQKINVAESVTSPSFGIENQYNTPQGLIHHFDLYRIEDISELDEFGFYETLDSGELCLIEWPEKANEIWQDYDVTEVRIEVEGDGLRRIFVV